MSLQKLVILSLKKKKKNGDDRRNRKLDDYVRSQNYNDVRINIKKSQLRVQLESSIRQKEVSVSLEICLTINCYITVRTYYVLSQCGREVTKLYRNLIKTT